MADKGAGRIGLSSGPLQKWDRTPRRPAANVSKIRNKDAHTCVRLTARPILRPGLHLPDDAACGEQRFTGAQLRSFHMCRGLCPPARSQWQFHAVMHDLSLAVWCHQALQSAAFTASGAAARGGHVVAHALNTKCVQPWAGPTSAATLGKHWSTARGCAGGSLAARKQPCGSQPAVASRTHGHNGSNN